MPNWTTNNIRIHGNAEVLKQIRDLVRGEPQGEEGSVDHFSFDKMMPMPKILNRVVSPPRHGENGRIMIYAEGASELSFNFAEATVEEQAQIDACHPYTDWYNWAVDNWGTKWRAHAEDWNVSVDGTTMFITFDTAWDAPRPIFEKFAEFLDKLGVTYNISCVHEDGEQFEELHKGLGADYKEVRHITAA